MAESPADYLARRLEEGATRHQIAKEFGVHVRTVYAWLAGDQTPRTEPKTRVPPQGVWKGEPEPSVEGVAVEIAEPPSDILEDPTGSWRIDSTGAVSVSSHAWAEAKGKIAPKSDADREYGITGELDLRARFDLPQQFYRCVDLSPLVWPAMMDGEVFLFHRLKGRFLPRPPSDPEAVKERVAEWIAERGPKRKLRKHKIGSERCALEVAIYDMHLGKWSEDPNGQVNWDLEIGEEAFRNAVERTIARASIYKPELIVFPIGNDWGHVDTIFGTTTSGTQVETLASIHRIMKLGQSLLVWAVEEFAKIAPVLVISVPGNHDYHSTFWLADFLWAYFKNDENITVDRGTSERKYWRYGASLIGFHHGKSVRGARGKPNLKKLPLKMAKEAAKDFGDTRFHEWHLGHLHHQRVFEDTGVYLRGIASLTSFTDAYHDSWPFQTPRASEAFLWHYDEGLAAWFNFPFFGEGELYEHEVLS